jgi:hypothetical protein
MGSATGHELLCTLSQELTGQTVTLHVIWRNRKCRSRLTLAHASTIDGSSPRLALALLLTSPNSCSQSQIASRILAILGHKAHHADPCFLRLDEHAMRISKSKFIFSLQGFSRVSIVCLLPFLRRSKSCGTVNSALERARADSLRRTVSHSRRQ